MKARAAPPLRASARLSEVTVPPPAAPRSRPPVDAAARRARAAERAREVEDSPRVLRDKCRRLARALRNAKHLVVYTGAGISTAADIPDYRGPRGVWTRLQRGESVGRVEVSGAEPTFTHMALTALWARGALKFVVSQNCDGLHLRAGLPRRALAELHGDMFAELCAPCRRLYLRAFDTTQRTARHRHATARLCHACGQELRDSIVHFGERGRAAWPLNWAGALRHAARADVVLCLGSSLKVLRRYSPLWRMHSAPALRPQLYIVNLQWTPKDAAAALKINARCDAVMRQVARRLRLRVPRYRRARDPLLAHAEPLAPPEAHTCARPAAAPAAPPSDRSDRTSEPSSLSEPSSPSASDSDEEVPLRRLADRLRAPPPHPRRHPPRLRAFQVELEGGEATILLRAEHAPAHTPPPARSPPRSATAELRRFRMWRRPPDPPPRPCLVAPPNGYSVRPPARDAPPAPLLHPAGTNGWNSRSNGFNVRSSLPPLVKPKEEVEHKMGPNGTLGSRLRQLLEREPRVGGAEEPPDCKPKLEPKEEEAEECAGSLAAAIIARAVLLCRASLYPGLHTIIAPPPPAAPAPAPAAPAPSFPSPSPSPCPSPAAECAWCWRHHTSRRCLWYGPPRETPLAGRAWRRVRGRRYLCACCPPAGGAPLPPAAGGATAAAAGGGGEGGWYGKGYRKGRRRRR